jgi:hypothetical protein
MYPELKEPTLTFAQILAMLQELSEEELENLNVNDFATSLISR